MNKLKSSTSSILILILAFALAKLLVHLFTFDNYGLHRDAYLYYALGEHLQWGFVAVPPSIALFSNVFTGLFGNTVFALRVVPAIIGALSVILVGLMVKEMGGKKIAISLASLAYLLGPAYLHGNTLFQPVSFNHFYWILSAYLILLMVRRKNTKMWLWIGLVFGLAFLNKYSIVFFYAAFSIALLISKHWRLYLSKYFLAGAGVGLLIILPNIIWQYNHNWPVMHHMEELRNSQLVHVSTSGFLFDQLLMNAHAFFIWFPAWMILLFYRKGKEYRIFCLIFTLIILLLLFGSGKSYYTLGIYPVMFAFGGCFIEKYTNRKYLCAVASLLVIIMTGSLIYSMRLDGIPFMKPEQIDREESFHWEDGRNYSIPQDMADMMGWEEIAKEVIKIYKGLTSEEKENVAIYAEHYGQAGALMFYGKEHHLPEPICFNGSFALWAPDSLSVDLMIAVFYYSFRDSDMDSTLKQWFQEYSVAAVVDEEYFRESGTKIVLGKHPTERIQLDYQEKINKTDERYGLHRDTRKKD